MSEEGLKLFGHVSDRFSDPCSRFFKPFSGSISFFFGDSFVLLTRRPNNPWRASFLRVSVSLAAHTTTLGEAFLRSFFSTFPRMAGLHPLLRAFPKNIFSSLICLNSCKAPQKRTSPGQTDLLEMSMLHLFSWVFLEGLSKHNLAQCENNLQKRQEVTFTLRAKIITLVLQKFENVSVSVISC